jgi:ankyrin repeat protein
MVTMQVGRTPLHVAAEVGNAALLRQFADIAETVDIGDKRGFTPLHACTSKTGERGRRLTADKLQCMEILIHFGANLDACDAAGFTPLHYAADNGNVAAVQLLLAKGCSVHAPGPVCFAPSVLLSVTSPLVTQVTVHKASC